MSTQVLLEFYDTVTRKFGVSCASAAKLTRRYAQLCNVAITLPILFSAIDRHASGNFSFWDALIVEAALAGGATTLFSEGMQDGYVVGALTIRNPFSA